MYVAAEAIEQVSGQSWGSIVSDKILEPLDLHRTFANASVPEDNYAMAYMPGLDGTLTCVGRPAIANGTVQQGANGIKTTVSDLLTYYKAVLHS
jgi:CubicO group peptidase (beta-lactamase class C family)